jgi:hypothetical protein
MPDLRGEREREVGVLPVFELKMRVGEVTKIEARVSDHLHRRWL